MDTNILWVWFILTFVALGFELGYHHEFKALRENMVKNDYGKFEYDDFNWYHKENQWHSYVAIGTNI